MLSMSAILPVHCETWDLFQEKLKTFLGSHYAMQGGKGHATALLFRGQSDAGWRLQTTLERYSSFPLTFQDYFRHALAIKPQIEAYTDRTWDIDESHFSKALEDGMRDTQPRFGDGVPGYSYLAYLRHHGFPSPLLDWSRSPYVAAFFAFQPTSGIDDNVAIFAYRYSNRVIHPGPPIVDSPRVFVCGPAHDSTHQRHFTQQCDYTICYASHTATIPLLSHEDVSTSMVPATFNGPGTIQKFTIPRAVRPDVLEYLDQFNLNAYSLFGSEESLMETLAARSLAPRRRRR
jgi:hypothetical protein